MLEAGSSLAGDRRGDVGCEIELDSRLRVGSIK